jgi:hypothetical protein
MGLARAEEVQMIKAWICGIVGHKCHPLDQGERETGLWRVARVGAN